MSGRSKQDSDELLRKAREYVERHERNSKRGDSDGKRSRKDKRKHNSNREDEQPRRRKDRDHRSDDEGNRKDSKKRKKEKDSSSRKRSKSGRQRDKSDDSIQADLPHKKTKEASKSKSKDKKRSKEKKSGDIPSEKVSKSSRNRHDDDSSSGGDRKKDKKRQKRSKKEKEEHKNKKHKKKDKKHQKSKCTEEIKKITSLIGPITDKQPEKKISSDDYFTYHNHLRLFLYHKEGVYFEDLSSTETHKAFEAFCDKYNSGQLEQAYYNKKLTLPDEAMEACKRTKHRWKFNTNTTEQRSLDLIKSGVKKQTEYQSNNTPSKRSLPFPPPASAMQCLPASNLGAQTGDNINNMERPKIPERKAEPRVKENIDTAKDKQDAMLKMLGIKAGQKITIAPRN